MDDQSAEASHNLQTWSAEHRIGIAADHGGFALKSKLISALEEAGCAVVDFGAHSLDPDDDYPDLVGPLARAVADGEVARGLAICGSGVGTCIAANKIAGVRAASITDCFSAHQGVEDDDMNILCLGAQVTGTALAWDLVKTFLSARFKGTGRYTRRLEKVAAMEQGYEPRPPILAIAPPLADLVRP